MLNEPLTARSTVAAVPLHDWCDEKVTLARQTASELTSPVGSAGKTGQGDRA